jgi:uncharacterized protein (DUF2252 family)
MAESAHAYVRGSTSQFYEWLKGANRRSVPVGPPVWICGDCHIGNLGPVADAKGRVAVQMRDFDQAVIGNPAHDMVRLGLSLAMAARGSDLPGVTTAKMLEQMVDGYASALAWSGRDDNRHIRKPDSVQFALKEAVRRSWKELLTERIEDTSPKIPLGSRFWPLARRERHAIDQVFGTEKVRKLITSLRCRDDDASVDVLDAAYWMKGCSSLGRLRFAVLVRVGSASVKKGSICLMDVKEAVRSCAPRTPKAAMPSNHGDRVVAAARAMAPFLGERMRVAQILGRSVFIRELLPQDLKIEIEHVSQDEAIQAARFLATVVGRAHARQMDTGARKSWRAEVRRHRLKSLEAPSWLWSSVVELVANHERAYLEHCRRYALHSRAP